MFNFLIPVISVAFALSSFGYLNNSISNQDKIPDPIEMSLVDVYDGDESAKLSQSEIKFLSQLNQGKIDFNDFPKPWIVNYNKLIDQNDKIILNLENFDIYKSKESISSEELFNLKSVSAVEFVKGERKLAFQDSLSSFSEIDLNDGVVKKFLIDKEFVNLSSFNGKYYFISDLNAGYICADHKTYRAVSQGDQNLCNYYEHDPLTQAEKVIFKKVFIQFLGNLQPDLRYVDQSNYWLTDAFGDSCTSYSTNTKISKTDLKERYSITYTNACGDYTVTEKINDTEKVLFEGGECPSRDTGLCDIASSGAFQSKQIYRSKLWSGYEDPIWRNDPPNSFKCGMFSAKIDGGEFSSNSKSLTDRFTLENLECVI